MTTANSFGKEEVVLNLHRMLRVFACKQEDVTEEEGNGDMCESLDQTGNDSEQAFGQTLKGT